MLWFIPGKPWDRHSVIPVMGAGRHTFSLSSSFNTDLPEIPDFFFFLLARAERRLWLWQSARLFVGWFTVTLTWLEHCAVTRPEANHTHVVLMITVVVLLGSTLINWKKNNANSDPRRFKPHRWREQLHFSPQYLIILLVFWCSCYVSSSLFIIKVEAGKIPLSTKVFISTALLYQTC